MLEHIGLMSGSVTSECAHEVNFICADDAHGTPIMLKAQQLGITPEQMIGEMSQEHQTDFAGFNISYDNYHSTHSEENRQLSELIYSPERKRFY